ncbi:MAG TPA: nitronate monooxygenase [Kineosporiaceae bacterium]
MSRAASGHDLPDSHDHRTGLPLIIQGGMGVAVSDWRLASAVTRAGQLGVVSGTALEIVCTRRLQDGDPGGHVRRALAAFPVRRIADWIIAAYFVQGGKPPDEPYKAVPRCTLQPSPRLSELIVAANFAEVFLAKEHGRGAVGINYLRKIEMPLPAAVYGALLAGVDDVLIGAGNPGDLPELVRHLCRHDDVSMPVRVQGARSSDGPYAVDFSPSRTIGAPRAPLTPPRVLAIVASLDLAQALAADPTTRPDGFVLEGPCAGGHNAPPRGPRRTDERGQPVYDDRDRIDLADLVAVGLPVWAAGGYGTPDALRAALAAGAAGIQVGTAFAFCAESGLDPDVKSRALGEVRRGTLSSRSDWRCSPTGFPFRVVELAGTLSESAVRQARTPVCDLGMLRSAYVTSGGTVGYRCPAEPLTVYTTRKAGRAATAEGRVCLCNALLATAGLPQRRRNGYREPPLVTAGSDLTAVLDLIGNAAAGTPSYSAAQVIAYLLGQPEPPAQAPVAGAPRRPQRTTSAPPSPSVERGNASSTHVHQIGGAERRPRNLADGCPAGSGR